MAQVIRSLLSKHADLLDSQLTQKPGVTEGEECRGGLTPEVYHSICKLPSQNLGWRVRKTTQQGPPASTSIPHTQTHTYTPCPSEFYEKHLPL